MSALAPPDAVDLLYREGHHLDAQRWDDWLALYCEDAEFWMPAWKEPHALTESPDREVSLIYYSARAGLEDRVWRVRSGLSVASLTLPRTAHVISGVVLEGHSPGGGLELRSTWTCHVYDVKRAAQHVFFGRYEHRLRNESGRWLIAAKKIVLLNDRIPTMIDFYYV
ncbi:MAG: aromatic-ring-hydroxylating dioxygenase subunit beta [Burkholderiales bacterium]